MISGINEILSENSALIALIGEDKIYPMVVPQGVEPPFLATSLARSGTFEVKGQTSDLDFPVLNVNVHADSYDSLESVASAVKTALNNINATTDAGYVFSRIFFINEADRPDLYTMDRPLYARSIQFSTIVKR